MWKIKSMVSQGQRQKSWCGWCTRKGHFAADVKDKNCGATDVKDKNYGVAHVKDKKHDVADVKGKKLGVSEVKDKNHGVADVKDRESWFDRSKIKSVCDLR